MQPEDRQVKMRKLCKINKYFNLIYSGKTSYLGIETVIHSPHENEWKMSFSILYHLIKINIREMPFISSCLSRYLYSKDLIL
jgi:hypothetical protein